MKTKSSIKRYVTGHSIGFHIFTAFFWLWALALCFICFWGICVSLNDTISYSLNPSKIFPKTINFSNYINAFRAIEYNNTNFYGMIFNTLWYAVGSALIRTFVTVVSAYTISRYDFPGKKFLYAFVVLQMMIPTYGNQIASYQLLMDFKLLDSPMFLITQAAGHGMYFLIIYSFFTGTPKDYAESAKIDGANDWVICFKISLPMAINIVLALFITQLMTLWNDYSSVMIYLPSYPTIASGLFRYREIATFSLNMPTYFAGMIISALPILVLWIVFNETLMTSMTIGGLKG